MRAPAPFLVLAAEEVAVEDLEVEQGREPARRRVFPVPTARSLPSIRSRRPRRLRTIISGAVGPNFVSKEGTMLLDGVNHVAVITDDTDRFVRFYEEVFDATVSHARGDPPGHR